MPVTHSRQHHPEPTTPDKLYASDETIFQKAKSGDRNAVGELVKFHYPKIINYLSKAHRITKQDAEDLAQEVFILCFRKIHKINNAEHLNRWLIRSATNYGRNHIRKQKTKALLTFKLSLFEEQQAVDNTPEKRLDRSAQLIVAQQAFTELPRKLREALYLRERLELSYLEIAQILDLNLNTAKSRIHQARKRLVAIYEKRGHHNEY